jgi:hypothetical protein
MIPFVATKHEAENLVLAFGLFGRSKNSANCLTIALNYASRVA